MATNNQLNYGWLADLPNPHHDGTTQQIDDHVQAFETDNAGRTRIFPWHTTLTAIAMHSTDDAALIQRFCIPDRRRKAGLTLHAVQT